MEELIFDDLTPIEMKVSINKTKYVLREADEGDAIKWKNAGLRAARVVDGKVVSMGDLADSEPLLVSLCLYKANADGTMPLNNDGTPNKKQQVPVSVIKTWPPRVVNKLFDHAKRISELEEKETRATLEEKLKEVQAKIASLDQENASKKELAATSDISG